MATDPVSAFLTGFRAVDQFETNKLNRQFAREQQSRLRTVWERQDELWAREELAYMQSKRMEQLEAYSADLMQELKRKSDEVRDAHLKENPDDEKGALAAQAAWLDNWYGDNPEKTFNSQVLRNWAQADPEAMEHLALAFGRDPSAGPLVDGRNPVANVGIAPDWLSDGSIKLWMEYNRKDGGKGPATKFRTDRPNDPVDLLVANTPAMVNFFGPGYRTSKTPMIMRWREQIDAQEAKYIRGNVSEEEQARRNSTAGAGSTTAGAGGATTSDTTTGVEASAEMPAFDGPYHPDYDPETGFNPTYEPPTQGGPEYKPPGTWGARATDKFGREVPTTQEIYGGVGPSEETKEKLTSGTTRMPRGRAAIEWQAGMGNTMEAPEPPAPGSLSTPTTKEEVPKDSSVNLSSARKGDTGGTPAATEQDAPAKAAIVAEASKSKRRVPFRHELYNAASLVEGGYMSKEDFQTFARTGSMPSDTEWRMFQTAQGIIAVGQNKTDGSMQVGDAISFGTGGVSREDVWKEFQNFQSAADKFYRTIEDDQQRQRVINSLSYAMELSGLDRIQITSGALGAHWEKAGRLFAGVDPDLQQGPWDTLKRVFTPGKTSEGYDFFDLQPLKEPGVYYGGAGLAMTQKMVMAGSVKDSSDVAMAMEQYSDHLPSILSMLGESATDTAILGAVEKIERMAATTKAGGTLDIKGPDGTTHTITFDRWANYAGERRDKILKELELIYSGYKGK